jgi:hypothetical protein
MNDTTDTPQPSNGPIKKWRRRIGIGMVGAAIGIAVVWQLTGNPSLEPLGEIFGGLGALLLAL